MVIGYTSGVFDLLHKGHLNYLQQCKEGCDVLYVGVDADHIVKIKKGISRPRQKEEIRCKQVEEISFVNFVMIKEKTTIELLKEIRPSVYFLPNNKAISDKIKVYAKKSEMNVSIIPYTHGISTTLLLENTYD